MVKLSKKTKRHLLRYIRPYFYKRVLKNALAAAAGTIKAVRTFLSSNTGKFFLVGTVMVVLFLANTFFLAKDVFNGTDVKIDIPEDTTAKDISKLLYESGVIGNKAAFEVSVRILGTGSKLKAGTYYFRPNMNNLSIIGALSEGRIYTGDNKITFPEGSSIYRMGQILQRKGIRVEDGSFYDLEYRGIDYSLRMKYPFLSNVPIESLEGYLFPDTYYLSKRIKREVLVELMLNRFDALVPPVYNASPMRKKYTLHQIITLASILEKEAVMDRELPIISSVFHNRLDSGWLLRADPTVKYALNMPTKRVLYSHLKVDSPYNTYKNVGLPPGPICNPGIKAVMAALYPAKTKYYYFVSNGDGTHTFSADWAGHAAGVERMRQRRNEK